MSRKKHTNKPRVYHEIVPESSRIDSNVGGEYFRMRFEIGTIKHLGLQMYSTLPPVIAELIANAYDADATNVDIAIPTSPVTPTSTIVVSDNGDGMTDQQVREAYLVIGRDRRRADGTEVTKKKRVVMGRKGIGKFCGFGIADEIELETVSGREISRFVMSYPEFEKEAEKREIRMPVLQPTGEVTVGTRVILRSIKKFHNRSIDIKGMRRGIARHFSIIGAEHRFVVRINGEEISPTERNLKLLLEKDEGGRPYIWEFDNIEVKPGTGWTVSGWIGALDRTKEVEDGIQRGIVIMARSKLVQKPFVFDATVGQQFALSYLVGELSAEFVDTAIEDGISTSRNSLVWDTEANSALMEWGKRQVQKIAREWAKRRSEDNKLALQKNPIYQSFLKSAENYTDQRSFKLADNFVKETIGRDPLITPAQADPVIRMARDFLEFDSFKIISEDVRKANLTDIPKLLDLFREWEVVEAKEMMRVTEGRLATIRKLSELIETNALEVPVLHDFLKEFPWVLDPRWSLIADEITYSKLLRDKFPEESSTPPEERRIDFLCVVESSTLVVVEIKRPVCAANEKILAQIERYVAFLRELVLQTTDESCEFTDVVGYLLCGRTVDTPFVRQKLIYLKKSTIFVRTYGDLLRMVERSHKDFIDRYDKLRKAKMGIAATGGSPPPTLIGATPSHLEGEDIMLPETPVV